METPTLWSTFTQPLPKALSKALPNASRANARANLLTRLQFQEWGKTLANSTNTEAQLPILVHLRVAIPTEAACMRQYLDEWLPAVLNLLRVDRPGFDPTVTYEACFLLTNWTSRMDFDKLPACKNKKKKQQQRDRKTTSDYLVEHQVTDRLVFAMAHVSEDQRADFKVRRDKALREMRCQALWALRNIIDIQSTHKQLQPAYLLGKTSFLQLLPALLLYDIATIPIGLKHDMRDDTLENVGAMLRECSFKPVCPETAEQMTAFTYRYFMVAARLVPALKESVPKHPLKRIRPIDAKSLCLAFSALSNLMRKPQSVETIDRVGQHLLKLQMPNRLAQLVQWVAAGEAVGYEQVISSAMNLISDFVGDSQHPEWTEVFVKPGDCFLRQLMILTNWFPPFPGSSKCSVSLSFTPPRPLPGVCPIRQRIQSLAWLILSNLMATQKEVVLLFPCVTSTDQTLVEQVMENALVHAHAGHEDALWVVHNMLHLGQENSQQEEKLDAEWLNRYMPRVVSVNPQLLSKVVHKYLVFQEDMDWSKTDLCLDILQGLLSSQEMLTEVDLDRESGDRRNAKVDPDRESGDRRNAKVDLLQSFQSLDLPTLLNKLLMHPDKHGKKYHADIQKILLLLSSMKYQPDTLSEQQQDLVPNEDEHLALVRNLWKLLQRGTSVAWSPFD